MFDCDILKQLLYNGSISACLTSSSYVWEWELYITFRARSCILSSFLLSDDSQKCRVRWQKVKKGSKKDLYNRSLALQGIKFRRRERTPSFWLALVHNLLICAVRLGLSSMWTPSSLISSVLAMFRSFMFRAFCCSCSSRVSMDWCIEIETELVWIGQKVIIGIPGQCLLAMRFHSASYCFMVPSFDVHLVIVSIHD